MAKLEVFQNGNFSSGEPVYQIGTKLKDGEYGEYGDYDIVVFDAMTKEEAEKKLAEIQPVKKAKATPKKKPSAKKVVPVPTKAELKEMTKGDLEIAMRKHGLELDKRKTKDSMIKESLSFLKGK
jgi:hypothetical protein|tara:strand:+ start:239 stop:610 length:372 start_codon:yes stop_codon:yes gene_type:complete